MNSIGGVVSDCSVDVEDEGVEESCSTIVVNEGGVEEEADGIDKVGTEDGGFSGPRDFGSQ